MLDEDLLVGGVSIALGLCALGSAICNWEWSYQLAKTRWIEARWGRGAARLFYAVLGVALIVLGAVITLGLAPNQSAGTSRRPSGPRRPRDADAVYRCGEAGPRLSMAS